MTLQLLRHNTRSGLSEEDIWNWYGNIAQELTSEHLDDSERAYLTAYYREAGLLRKWKRSFFRRHYAEPFRQALTLLCDGRQRPLIVDLGCGTGSQSLAFALRGARVVALDLDVNALKVLEKRKRFYEERRGEPLDITILAVDALKFDFAEIGPIDGVYSLFAFNIMQPTSTLLARIMPGLASGARVILQDGNRLCWLSHLPGRRRQVSSPLDLDKMFTDLEFARFCLQGAVSLPPLTWAILPYNLLSTIDAKLNQTWFWPISYLAMYQSKH